MSKDVSDATLRLPDGSGYHVWEQEQQYSRELYVNAGHPNASDAGDGTPDRPFRTINAAAALATPGTHVWIHGGTYRECVHPAKGGDGADAMICYEAFGGEEVVIKASYVASSFARSEGWNLTRFRPGQKPAAVNANIWAVKLDPKEFSGYNPFCAVNILHDRLFIEYDKTDMTTYLNRRGMVFCDGKPLKQVPLYYQMGVEPGTYWVEANGQTVHFRLLGDADPANHVIELTCREQCFAPEDPFLSYIKVKGLTCAHAATGAPVPQRGAISCYRGHHWIIEDCTIDWANGVGIDIGNECWHHTFDENQTIGSAVIRRCKILDAGVCGIAGMFAKNLLVEDNLIQGTGWQKMELSWEAGGIKVHHCVDSVIRRNVFTKTLRADHLWMDVDNLNNRITGNLFLDGIEQREAIFMECSRDDVNLIDNNIFWNVEGRFDPKAVPSEPGSSGWYKEKADETVNGYAIYGEGTDRLHIVHNFIGKCRHSGYYAKIVPFRITDARGGTSREANIRNNVFYDCGEAAVVFPTKHNTSEGNLYANMPGGYLRIKYPLPEECLDLSTWQEFYGFDLTGYEGYFDIDVDTDNLTMHIRKASALPRFRSHAARCRSRITDPADCQKVAVYDQALCDFSGDLPTEDKRLPGPFISLPENASFSIDPRKPQERKR